MNHESFPIGIQAKLKHGLLMQALEERNWNQSQAAKFLGISDTTFGRWINMQETPKDLSAELIVGLYELTGRPPEEIWPNDVFTPEFLASPKSFRRIKEVPKPLLATFGIIRSFPLSPDKALEKRDLERALDETLKTLPPRQRDVIIGRFLDGKTLEEVGADLGVTAPRIRQIEGAALRRLRHPIRSRRLEGYYK